MEMLHSQNYCFYDKNEYVNVTSLPPNSIPQIWISDDLPDWSQFAWENPEKIVYGPVSSRRLGKSLGINFFPSGKICSFQCSYCDMDVPHALKRKPKLLTCDKLIKPLRQHLLAHLSSGNAVDSITFAGNGEPTIHPSFSDLVDAANKIRLFPRSSG